MAAEPARTHEVETDLGGTGDGLSTSLGPWGRGRLCVVPLPPAGPSGVASVLSHPSPPLPAGTAAPSVCLN